jgi:hypothetical protein
MLTKHLDYFLVSELIVRLISFSKLKVVLELNLMHLLLHLFAALQSIFELFAHSLAYFLLSPELFLGNFND